MTHALANKNSAQIYQELCSTGSDINEHLPILKQYTKNCESVTEMGVRFACSTWAFIEGKPKKLRCHDINYEFFKPSEFYVEKACKDYGIDFKFILGDSLKINIENTDLLFIDTLHTYEQLYNELILHCKQVNKWIILHDTKTFGHADEDVYEHASDIIKHNVSAKSGLVEAINDFLKLNINWFIKEIFTNNNGLTVLEKK